MKNFFSLKAQSYFSSILIAIGLLCGFIQNKYYGYIDDEGVLHDSLFLPLSAFFIIMGALIAIAILSRFIWINIKK
jgi:hypothetical protein